MVAHVQIPTTTIATKITEIQIHWIRGPGSPTDTGNPESTEAMGRGVDTRDDGQGKANGASPIPIDGDEGGVR